MPDRHDVCVVREDLIRDRIDVLVLGVPRKLQLDQVPLFQRRSVCRVRLVLQQPPQDILMVENHPRGGTHRRREWLQAQCAEVEWKSFECRLCAFAVTAAPAHARAS